MEKRKVNFCKLFGAHLRKIRENKKIGMREFALLAEIEYSQLSKIEKGTTNPTLFTIIKLSNALKIEHSELFKFELNNEVISSIKTEN